MHSQKTEKMTSGNDKQKGRQENNVYRGQRSDKRKKHKRGKVREW